MHTYEDKLVTYVGIYYIYACIYTNIYYKSLNELARVHRKDQQNCSSRLKK